MHLSGQQEEQMTNVDAHKDNSNHLLAVMARIVAEDDAQKRAAHMVSFMHFYEYLNADSLMYAIYKDAQCSE